MECIERLYPRGYLQAIVQVFLARKEEMALKLLERHKGKKIAGTLSGKDSLVALHLGYRVHGKIDVIISRYVGRRKLPDEIVDELIEISKPFAKTVTISETPWGPHSNLFNIITRSFDYEAIIAGLRYQEDGDWPYRIGNMEIVTPIARWRHSDVWAYIAKYNLRIPSVYCLATTPRHSLQSIVFNSQ